MVSQKNAKKKNEGITVTEGITVNDLLIEFIIFSCITSNQSKYIIHIMVYLEIAELLEALLESSVL